MKLIIEIPEEIKAVIDRKGTNEIISETLWQSVKNGTPFVNSKQLFDDLIEELNILRIDIDAECQYCDPTGVLREKYERVNEMLDDCIFRVKEYINKL